MRTLRNIALCIGAALAPVAQAQVPASAEFIAKTPDPRGGDAAYNTFKRLADGRGIAFAGFSHNHKGINSVSVYDPVTDQWQITVPHNNWIDVYDVSGRDYLGNRDDHATFVIDNKYWALDGERGVSLYGNWRGVLDTLTWQWAIDDLPTAFGPTGTALGNWGNSAAGWIPGLDIGYLFGGMRSGAPTDALIRIERNPPGTQPPFRFTEYRNTEDDDPPANFQGTERLIYISNQQWVRGSVVHIYGGRQQIRYSWPDQRVDSRNLWQLTPTHPPSLSILSTNTLPDGQRIEGAAVLAYHDPARDIAVITNGQLVNVYVYATNTWHHVPILTPPDLNRNSPSATGAGRAGFYAPEIDQFIILGGNSWVYGLKLNFTGPTVPSAPLNVVATAGNASATLTFSPPLTDGGSPITSYAVVSSPPGGVDQQAGTAATTRTITGLVNGTSYTFVVTATNSVGTSAASAPSNPVTPASGATVPGSPTNVMASAGNSSATVTFTPPASNGGSPITSYAVASSPPGGVDQQAGTTATTRTITGLVNGTSYTFTVTATNAVGTGPASSPSNAVTPATVPGAPTNVVASAGNGSATLTFTPPASNGGSPITSYAVVSSPPGGVDQQAGTTATTRTITGLVNGTSYTFTVTATNAIGTGAPSAPSNAIVPFALPTPPGSPVMVTAAPGDASATIVFAPPASDGGSAILGYTVTSTPPGGVDVHADTPSLSHVVSNLVNGVSYTFVVTARNAIGTGPASAPSNAVTPQVAANCAGFVDVPGDSPFCPSIEWLRNRAITLGCGQDQFCPNDPVTRLALAAFVQRTGAALTPLLQQVESLPGSLDVAAQPVVCASTALAAAPVGRSARLSFSLSAAPAGTTTFAVLPVASVDGGGNWSSPVQVAFRAGGIAAQQAQVHGHAVIPMAPDTGYRFALRLFPVGGATALADVRCHLTLEVTARNGDFTPFDTSDVQRGPDGDVR